MQTANIALAALFRLLTGQYPCLKSVRKNVVSARLEIKGSPLRPNLDQFKHRPVVRPDKSEGDLDLRVACAGGDEMRTAGGNTKWRTERARTRIEERIIQPTLSSTADGEPVKR